MPIADRPKPSRRSIRLPQYDYAQAGVYFVTVCCHRHRCILGKIDNFQIHLNWAGRLVAECWLEIPYHFANAVLDAFVVMPNHLHGIVVLNVGAQHAAPLQRQTSTVLRRNVSPGSLSAIVRSFKSAASKRFHEHKRDLRVPLWQRNYYEHVVRNGEELDAIRRYIWTNAERWAEDKENPANLNAPRDTSKPPFL